jgi:putative membrane protein
MKIIALLAAAIHFYFFILESILWTRPSTLKAFRMKPADAETTRVLAFNQGFYNLFLVGAVLVGLVLGAEGKILVDYAMASMLLASLVLFFSKKGMLRGALIQGLLPAIYFVYQYAQMMSAS